MKRCDTSDRCKILACLVEGCSVRSTCRMTGAAKGTVLKLVADLGEACEAFHDESVRGIRAKRVQCDEIWSFCGSKAKNVPADKLDDENYGDVWTWTAIDSDSKLMVSWYVGDRDAECAGRFMRDLSDRLAGRCQLTTDGHRVYEWAVQDAFGWNVDYAMLVNLCSLLSFRVAQRRDNQPEMQRLLRSAFAFS